MSERDTEQDDSAARDFTAWLQRLMVLADSYWAASIAEKQQYRGALLEHATSAGMHWEALAPVRGIQPDDPPCMFVDDGAAPVQAGSPEFTYPDRETGRAELASALATPAHVAAPAPVPPPLGAWGDAAGPSSWAAFPAAPQVGGQVADSVVESFVESAAAACEEYASEMKGKQAEGAMECARRLRGNIPRLKAWAFQDAHATPLAAQIPGNVIDKASCGSSVSDKAAHVAAPAPEEQAK